MPTSKNQLTAFGFFNLLLNFFCEWLQKINSLAENWKYYLYLWHSKEFLTSRMLKYLSKKSSIQDFLFIETRNEMLLHSVQESDLCAFALHRKLLVTGAQNKMQGSFWPNNCTITNSSKALFYRYLQENKRANDCLSTFIHISTIRFSVSFADCTKQLFFR